MDVYKTKKIKNEKIVLLVLGLGLFILGGAGILLSGYDVIVMGAIMMVGGSLIGGAYIKHEEGKALVESGGENANQDDMPE